MTFYAIITHPTFLLIIFVMFVFRAFSGNSGPMEHFDGEVVTEISSMEEYSDLVLATKKKEEVKSGTDEADAPSQARSSDEKLVVIDAYATWCPPCRKCSPVYGKLSTEYSDASVQFCRFDIDVVNALATKLGIQSVPTFVILKGGKVVDTLRGFNEPQLVQSIKKHGGMRKKLI